MAWDVTVPDNFADSHIGSTATKPAAAASKTAQNKAYMERHGHLADTRIGRRITAVTEDTGETA